MIEREATCVVCGAGFIFKNHRQAKFCSDSCKCKDYRARHPLSDEKRRQAVERAMAWAKANPERHQENRRVGAKRRAGKDRERRMQPSFKAKRQAYMAVYYRLHSDKFKARARDRKAVVRGGSGRVRPGRVKELMRLQRGRCAVCRVALAKSGVHVDHVMPLHRGGEHEGANLQLLCPTCNRAKSAKHPVDFMRERGFLC